MEIFICRKEEGKKPAYRNCGCNEMYRNKKKRHTRKEDERHSEMRGRREEYVREAEREREGNE